jgi:hypothetical protein
LNTFPEKYSPKSRCTLTPDINGIWTPQKYPPAYTAQLIICTDLRSGK